MEYLYEYKSFYKEGDVVLIEYWYNGMITPVEIIERLSSRKLKVSHNTEKSEIKNAPDEIINSGEIIDLFR